MLNKRKIKRALIALTTLISGRSFGQDYVVTNQTLADAGVPSNLVAELVASRILARTASGCYSVDKISLESALLFDQTEDLAAFANWLSEISQGASNVQFCGINDMQLASQDLSTGDGKAK